MIRTNVESLLSGVYELVPQERYQKAEKEAFESLDLQQCTEEQCMRRIQEILQIDRLFILQIIRVEEFTQMSLNLVRLDSKRVVKKDCLKCSIAQLSVEIQALARKLIEEDLGTQPHTAAVAAPAASAAPAAPASLSRTGRVFISSQPSGASIVLDGQARPEKTDALLEDIAAGEHKVVLSQGDLVREHTFRVETGKLERVELKLESAQATLLVTSTPFGAEVTLDGKQVGKTPVQVQAKAGKHTVLLLKRGFAKYRTEITLRAEQQARVQAKLEKLPPLVNPILIAAGGSHTCATTDNGVTCWGEDNKGQGSPPRMKNPTRISAGEGHTCAISERKVVCWGDNQFGQARPPALKRPDEIAVGGSTSCAVDDSGIVCWGRLPVPAEKIFAHTYYGYVSGITVAGDHLCWRGSRSEVECVGKDDFGQSSRPTGAAEDTTAFSAGDGYTCVLSGRVRCWGRNDFGQSSPPNLRSPRTLSAGKEHACAIDDTGVVCWGNNKDGQAKPPPLKNPIAVSAGKAHTCAIADNRVVCWGSNSSGQASPP